MQTQNKTNTGKPVIELYCGLTRDGQFFYAYLSIPQEKYLKYHAYIAMKKPINLLEFGEIVECGFGSKPSMKVQERMAMLGAQREFVGHVTPIRQVG